MTDKYSNHYLEHLINQLDVRLEHSITLLNDLKPLAEEIEQRLDNHDTKIETSLSSLLELDSDVSRLKKNSNLNTILLSFILSFTVMLSVYGKIYFGVFDDFRNDINKRLMQIELNLNNNNNNIEKPFGSPPREKTEGEK